MLYSVLYVGSMDRIMVLDSRYETEQWMDDSVDKNALIGMASPREYLPRSKGRSFKNLEFSMETVITISPDYIMLNVDYRSRSGHSPVHERFFSELEKESTGYNVIYDGPQKRIRTLYAIRNLDTNLDKISPRIRIYKKIHTP
jgi:hypothetical protein